MQRKMRGFTLIELLVVIAIIALLMSILMPALAKVKRQAQGVACQSVLRQWAVMLTMYTEDYDGRVPTYMRWDASKNGWSISSCWIVVLHKYYPPNDKIFFCPTATKLRENLSDVGDKSTFAAWSSMGGYVDNYRDYLPRAYVRNDGTVAGSYGYNRCLADYDTATIAQLSAMSPTVPPRAIKDVRIAGGNYIPVFGDNMQTGGDFYYTSPAPAVEGMLPYNSQDIDSYSWVLNRHGNKNEGITNLSFLDGTVRKVGLKELWVLHWNKLWKEDMQKAGGPPIWSKWMEPFKDYAK